MSQKEIISSFHGVKSNNFILFSPYLSRSETLVNITIFLQGLQKRYAIVTDQPHEYKNRYHKKKNVTWPISVIHNKDFAELYNYDKPKELTWLWFREDLDYLIFDSLDAFTYFASIHQDLLKNVSAKVCKKIFLFTWGEDVKRLAMLETITPNIKLLRLKNEGKALNWFFEISELSSQQEKVIAKVYQGKDNNEQIAKLCRDISLFMYPLSKDETPNLSMTVQEHIDLLDELSGDGDLLTMLNQHSPLLLRFLNKLQNGYGKRQVVYIPGQSIYGLNLIEALIFIATNDQLIKHHEHDFVFSNIRNKPNKIKATRTYFDEKEKGVLVLNHLPDKPLVNIDQLFFLNFFEFPTVVNLIEYCEKEHLLTTDEHFEIYLFSSSSANINVNNILRKKIDLFIDMLDKANKNYDLFYHEAVKTNQKFNLYT